jgi:hypothetical protein
MLAEFVNMAFRQAAALPSLDAGEWVNARNFDDSSIRGARVREGSAPLGLGTVLGGMEVGGSMAPLEPPTNRYSAAFLSVSTVEAGRAGASDVARSIVAELHRAVWEDSQYTPTSYGQALPPLSWCTIHCLIHYFISGMFGKGNSRAISLAWEVYEHFTWPVKLPLSEHLVDLLICDRFGDLLSGLGRP